jgi:glycosyltransferase involved in cell wall biosynthesis
MKLPVSCFMITRNEADRVSRSIRAVRDLVDEIIVVDSGSTDHTISLAATEGARVIHNDWPGFGRQKQFGEAQCRNDWVFNIDADEVVTPQLASELRALFATGVPPKAAYGVWVQGVYPGQNRPRWWARDHYCLRLYDRRRAGFTDSAMHDSVDARGQSVGHLTNCIHHFSFRSLADLAAKSDARAEYGARHMKPKSPWVLRARMLTEFQVNFVKYYLGRRHVTGGWTGLRVALIAAQYRWLRILRAYRFQELGRRHDSSVSPDSTPDPDSFGRSSGAEARRTTLQPLR